MNGDEQNKAKNAWLKNSKKKGKSTPTYLPIYLRMRVIPEVQLKLLLDHGPPGLGPR